MKSQAIWNVENLKSKQIKKTIVILMQINKKLKNGKCESGKFGNERLYINGNDMF